MNGILPETLEEFDEVLLEANKHSNILAVKGTIRCMMRLLGAMDDEELVRTVRNAFKSNEDKARLN